MYLKNFSEAIVRTIEAAGDGLVLVNGKWGTGKTYYFLNEFKKTYHHTPIFYISTLGVTTFSEFKDKLISTTYLDMPEDIVKLKDGISNALDAYHENSGKVFNSVIDIFGGALQERFLDQLEGTFIIDDIERIDEKVRSEILTYCVRHLQKNSSIDIPKRIKYIVIGNSSSENRMNITHKEKIFFDEVIFPGVDTKKYIHEMEKHFRINHLEAIAEIITDLNILNLRIINRILSKLNGLVQNQYEPSEQVKNNTLILAQCISAIILLKDVHKLTYDKLVDSETATLPDSENNKEEKTPDKIEIERLLSIVNRRNYHKKLCGYIFNIESAFELVDDIYPTIKEIPLEEYPSISRPELSGIDQEVYEQELYKFLTQDNIPCIKKWLTAIRNYVHLSSGGYIAKNPTINSTLTNKTIRSFSEHQLFQYIDECHPGLDDFMMEHYISRTDKYGKAIFARYIKANDIKIKTKLNNIARNEGWLSIGLEFDSHDLKFKILQTIDYRNIIFGILNTWETSDIRDFKNHLSSLYRFTNIEDFLAKELPHLKKLDTALKSLIKKAQPSFRTGEIKELHSTITLIKDKLESSMGA